jgi:hypothetical protein
VALDQLTGRIPATIDVAALLREARLGDLAEML